MIPNAPTDNLYKFLTFLGVALLIYCSWSFTEANKRLEIAIIEDRLAKENWQSRTAKMDEKIAELRQVTSDTSLSPALRADRTAEITIDVLQLAKTGVGAASAEMKPELDLLQKEDDTRLYKWGMWLGGFMTSVGSLLWYILHQRHQDALLKQQVIDARKGGLKAALPVRLPIWRRVASLRRVR